MDFLGQLKVIANITKSMYKSDKFKINIRQAALKASNGLIELYIEILKEQTKEAQS